MLHSTLHATAGSMLSATLLILATACAVSAPQPAALHGGQDACGNCRMIVSDPQFASQIVAPNEEPKFFDDMGCLARYLANTPALPAGAVAYVADHRTKAWVRADLAVYSRVDALMAPMGSHIVAHASAASRDADADAAKGTLVTLGDVFAGGRVPGGAR
jgi:copper chaperone NosL